MNVSTTLTIKTESVKEGIAKLRSNYRITRLGSGTLCNGLLTISANIEVSKEEMEDIVYYKNQNKVNPQEPLPHKLSTIRSLHKARKGKLLSKTMVVLLVQHWSFVP